jgi:hypothetical protein
MVLTKKGITTISNTQMPPLLIIIPIMMHFFTTAVLVAALMTGVSGFSCQQLPAFRTATSQLMMSSSSSESSRRDIILNAASFAAIGISALVTDPDAAAAASLRALTGGPVTAQSAANKAAESYQGVYTDPNHPEGYRVIMAYGKGAKMTLSDGAGDETYKNIPIGVSGNELSFDFSFSKYHCCVELLFRCGLVTKRNLTQLLNDILKQQKRVGLKAL